ncbi:MAG: hypothetical protein ABJA02_03415 [Acidobacteriota bacterium]
MKILIVIVLNLVFFSIGSAQEKKKPAEKLIELPALTKKIADEKLVPVWNAHKCDDPEIFYVMTYGTKNEQRRRKEIIFNSIGRRCDYSGFRIIFVEEPYQKDGPLTVVWRVAPDGEKPPF